MKLVGGYLPRIAGRPSAAIRDVPVPDRLQIDLRQGEILYAARVGKGQPVRFGEALAAAAVPGGTLALPSPAAGTVCFDGANGSPTRIFLDVTGRQADAALGPPRRPERLTAEEMRQALARGGVWPLLWSSRSKGMPPLDGSEQPRRILVTCVAVEPFKPRGKVILADNWARVAAGIAFLPRLLAEYGTVHVVLTALSDPLAAKIRTELAGQAWTRIESVPLRYPAEEPEVLCRALRRSDKRIGPDEIIWVADVQAIEAVGACLGEGLPLYQRIVAVGGPGASNPCHLRVRVGTRLDALLAPADRAGDRIVLRGGLFRGAPAGPSEAGVSYGDDAFFVLRRPEGRELLGFARPGFDRVSSLPCFASCLTGAEDRHLTTSLRGERRPCIACGLCEAVCPVGLLPQILHRCLYRGELGEAEEMGLNVCVRCGLCTYVCPSKIELRQEFEAAQKQQAAERAEAAAAEAERLRHEAERAAAQDRKDEWRK